MAHFPSEADPKSSDRCHSILLEFSNALPSEHNLACNRHLKIVELLKVCLAVFDNVFDFNSNSFSRSYIWPLDVVNYVIQLDNKSFNTICNRGGSVVCLLSMLPTRALQFGDHYFPLPHCERLKIGQLFLQKFGIVADCRISKVKSKGKIKYNSRFSDDSSSLIQMGVPFDYTRPQCLGGHHCCLFTGKTHLAINGVKSSGRDNKSDPRSNQRLIPVEPKLGARKYDDILLLGGQQQFASIAERWFQRAYNADRSGDKEKREEANQWPIPASHLNPRVDPRDYWSDVHCCAIEACG